MKVDIGIRDIGLIHLGEDDDYLEINDWSNDGYIKFKTRNIKKVIHFIKNIYNNHRKLDGILYGYDRRAIKLECCQSKLGLNILKSNYITISHMPDIIKMLKSVKVEKEKYILEKDNLAKLNINDLLDLQRIMKRRKKVFVDNNNSKYIEV